MNFLLGATLGSLAAAGIVPVSNFSVSTPAGSWTSPLKVVFWNFDKTLPIASVGHWLLNSCGGPNYFSDCGCQANNCTAYNISGAGQCLCTVDNNSFANYWTANYNSSTSIDNQDFNGTDRLSALNATLNTLAAAGVRNVVMSTSWWHVTATMWANFLAAYLQSANLQMFFNASTILTIADPGCNIAADKGTVIASYLATNGWSQHNGILIDKSQGNINSTSGKSDWLLVNPASGVAQDQLNYLNAWAAYTASLSMAPTMAKNPAAVAVPAASALVAWIFM